MFKSLSCFCTVMVLASCISKEYIFAANSQSGKVGNNITWRLEGDTLYLEGTGSIPVSTKQAIGGKNVSFTPENYNQFYNYTWKDVADSVKTLIISEGITGIGKQSFFLFPVLEAVTLPNTLTSIGPNAFAGCPQLETVYCPDSVTDFGADIFLGDNKMCSPEKPFCILNDTLVEYGSTKTERIVIPENVHRLAPFVLSGHKELQEITLPTGLTEIGNSALSNCTSLMTITIPNTVNRIGKTAFGNCSELKSISLSAEITELEDSIFGGCSALKEITIPESVQSIGNTAFVDCTSLQKISGCSKLECIGSNAFLNCVHLESIALPDTIQYISPSAFEGCDILKQMYTSEDSFVLGKVLISSSPKSKFWQIPDGVVTIANNALNKTNVFEITFPDSLRYVCSNALSDNTDLMELRLNTGLKSIGKNALSVCESLHTLVIPSTVSVIEPQENHSLTDIYGTPGSAAEQFAKENGIRFHNESEIVLSGKDLTIDYEKDGWYFGNSGDVFGGEYFLTEADRQRLLDFGRDTQGVDKEWEGSCVGLALTVILMKNGIFTPSDLQSGAQTLSDVQPTDAVRSFINYYQCTQGRDSSSTGMSDYQKVYYMSQHLPNVKYGESPFLLVFDCYDGSHGVVAYGLEEGTWSHFGRNYDRRILVWDSNYPDQLNDGSCLYYDSLTLDFCIPAYDVHVAEGASDNTPGLVSARNELNVLNAYPYQFPDDKPGDVNLDGSVTVADAVLLCKHLSTEAQLTGRAFRLADLSCDSNVNTTDLTLLKRQLLFQ